MKGNDMDKSKIVEDGARIFDAVEQRIVAAQAAARKLGPVLDEGWQAQMIGALQHGCLTAKAEEIHGLLARAKRLTYEMHQECTKVAQGHNVDIPQPRGGGGR